MNHESPVFVAASVYGTLAERRGQAYIAAMAARSGAAGFEIRRELLEGDEPPYEELRAAVQGSGLRAAYSVPVELWESDGGLNREQLLRALEEGRKLGAEFVKTTLGGYRHGLSDLSALRVCLEEAGYMKLPIQLTVENDQSEHGGRPAVLKSFLEDCAELHIPVRMTFDVGNWLWLGEDIVAAAQLLTPYIVYVHFKWSATCDGVMAAAPLPADADARWRDVLACFSAELPRVIEFPIAVEDSERATRYYVELLSQA